MKAFIVGYTGGIGRPLTDYIIQHGSFTSVRLIGRRETGQFKSSDKVTVEEKVVNFDELSADVFEGCDVGFSLLGTTRAKVSNREEYVKIDHDYVVNIAKLSQSVGCKHFLVVSSANANKDSRFFYLKLKGDVEDNLKGVGFARLSIFRPAFLASRTNEFRMGEKIIGFLLKPANLVSNRFSIPVETCARGMLGAATLPSLPNKEETKPFVIYENPDIHRLAALLKDESTGTQ